MLLFYIAGLLFVGSIDMELAKAEIASTKGQRRQISTRKPPLVDA